MDDLSTNIDNLKLKYREVFTESANGLNKEIDELKPKDACKNCKHLCNTNQTLFEVFPDDCAYKEWQKKVLKIFDEKILKDIYTTWVKMLQYRQKFSCSRCGACCKLACSEFSYEELKFKAQNGDNFAKQFTSVFVPYESEEQAKKIYPEYFELIKSKHLEGSVYFYHCPKVTKNNKCPDYENRPQICRDFPDNPLSFLPKNCGYTKWKEEVETTALMLRSMLEIVDFYKTKIPQD